MVSHDDCRALALEFARHLADRAWEEAWSLTGAGYRTGTTVEAMRDAFEAVVPADWGPVDPIEVGHTMDDWPGRNVDERLWVYVSLGGDVYSEALTVVVAEVGGRLRIARVEFGRP